MTQPVITCMFEPKDGLYISRSENGEKMTGKPCLEIEIQEHGILGRVDIAGVAIDRQGLRTLIRVLQKEEARMHAEEVMTSVARRTD